MTRILRARAAGGAPYNPKSVAGTINSLGTPREGSVRDAQQLLAFARTRARIQRTMSRLTIGSQGRL